MTCMPRCCHAARKHTLSDEQSLTVDVSSEAHFEKRIGSLLGRRLNDETGPRLHQNCCSKLLWPFNCCGVYDVAERQRQTMYDFVNDWSPEPFGLHHQGVWSKRSNCLGGAWRVITQTKDCLMSEHLDENNCKCTSHAKTARRRRLRSKSGFYLTVMPNGQVLGVKDPTNCYINLDVIPVGADAVKIWGVEAELFLMIDDAGLLRATDVDSPECIFEESMTEDFCTMYYSAMYSHKRWCVGLKTRPLSTFSGALRRNKLSLRDCSFISEIVNRRSSTSSSQSCGSDGRNCSI